MLVFVGTEQALHEIEAGFLEQCRVR